MALAWSYFTSRGIIRDGCSTGERGRDTPLVGLSEQCHEPNEFLVTVEHPEAPGERFFTAVCTTHLAVMLLSRPRMKVVAVERWRPRVNTVKADPETRKQVDHAMEYISRTYGDNLRTLGGW